MALKDWSTVAGNNNAAPPNGAPEGWAPSAVNNTIREIMAQVRGWFEDPMWINLGLPYEFVSTTSFKISGVDETSRYPVGRRVRAIGTSTGTIYGRITGSVFATDTTVTVAWDSGALSNETLQISLGVASKGKPIAYGDIDMTGQIILLTGIEDIAESRIVGRAAGDGTGVPQALTDTQVRTILGIKSAGLATLIDDDTMATATATNVPSAESVKAYVDGKSLGVGQAWQDVKASRAFATDYTNSTGKPICVNIQAGSSGGTGNISLLVDGVTVAGHSVPLNSAFFTSAIVPNGSSYRLQFSGSGTAFISIWAELR